MRPVAYIETSVISYLVAQPSRDLIIAARQQLTRDWWLLAGPRYRLMVSQLVRHESEMGDPVAARRRDAVMDDLVSAAVTDAARRLARDLVTRRAVPKVAPEDALHIAIAAVHGADLLLTWNFKHIANPFMWRSIWDVVARAGYNPPVITTPEVLLREDL